MTSAGVTGPLAEADAKRPPFVIATLLKNLLDFRNRLLDIFAAASIEPRPHGVSQDVVQVAYVQPGCVCCACV